MDLQCSSNVALRMLWLFMLQGLILISVGSYDPQGDDLKALVAFKKTITLDQWNCTDHWNSSSLVDICTDEHKRIICNSFNTTVLSLDLGGCNMLGQLVPELGNLTSLINLNLSGNALTGTIPPALRNLSKLEKLSLDNNFIEGEIPEELCNLWRNLRIFKLQLNNLGGVVSAALVRTFKNIQMVNLTDNFNLSGNCTHKVCSYGEEQ